MKSINLFTLCAALTMLAMPVWASRDGYRCGEGVVSLAHRGPANVAMGEEFVAETIVTACRDAANVRVSQMILETLEYVKSEPEARREGNMLYWTVPVMDKGETRSFKVTYKAKDTGLMRLCATVAADPRDCFDVCVTKAIINIQKDGPARAELNQAVTYTIVVLNEGDAPAKNVVVTDMVPPGLTHASGKKELSFTIGEMPPKSRQTLQVVFTAAERGVHTNKACVTTSNAGSACDDAVTEVVLRDLQVAKTGMKEQFINKVAHYEITVKNTGDTTLQGVQVTDQAQPPMRIVAAPDARMQGGQAVWHISELKPGESKSFVVKTTSPAVGTLRNCANASAEGLSRSACAETLWKGQAAILIEMIDVEDPVQIGEETEFIIQVTNQGTETDKNVAIKVEFPAEITPISARGVTEGKVEAKTVTFAPYSALAPKQMIEWRVRVKGEAAGDARTKAYLTSDLLKTPVVEEESTHVY